jgi:predicted enzyme related to lactoylglutathione lyase
LLPIERSVSQDGPPPPLPQPTEAQLGVPLYPGAKYDAQMSGGMTQPDTYYWIYTTTDAIEKVVSFYKQKTGLTPKDVSGSYIFSVRKGESELFPDHGVMVEPNKMLPPPAKTVISVIKKK